MLIVERADLRRCRKPIADISVRHVAEIVRHGITCNHFLVARIAARRQNNALFRVKRELCAVLARARHARNDAVFIGKQFVHGRVIYDFAAKVIFIVQSKRRGYFSALAVGLSAAAGGIMHAPRLETDMDRLDVEHVKVRFQHAVLFNGSGYGLPGLSKDLFAVALYSGLDG